MKQDIQNIVEGNKAIAEFMGIEFGKAKYSYRPGVEELLTEDHLNYHGSWGWLMPVVEKIEGMNCNVNIINRYCQIIKFESGDAPNSYQKTVTEKETKIENVWLSVIQFIQWYQQKQVKE